MLWVVFKMVISHALRRTYYVSMTEVFAIFNIAKHFLTKHLLI